MIKSIHEPAKELSVILDADVLVAGGGIAGFSAALASARIGARTLLVERYGYLGGMVTGGLVTMFPEVTDGINGELISTLDSVNAMARHGDGEFIATDPEIMKCVLDRMLESAKAKLLFHSLIVGVVREESRVIKAVIIEGKSGRQVITAKFFVDATGDGDIAFLSGCPFIVGGNSGRTLPVTSVFTLQGAKLLYSRKVRLDMTRLRQGEANCTPEGVEANALDPSELTKAEIALRKRILAWLTNRIKNKSESIFISQIAPQIGVRETRRITGQYTLTKSDWDRKVRFSDSIGLTYKHNEMPFRCLVPLEIDNLAVVGRCCSYSRDILDPMRIVTSCISTGQAGGTAAGLASMNSYSSISLLDPQLLAKNLMDQNIWLHQ